MSSTSERRDYRLAQLSKQFYAAKKLGLDIQGVASAMPHPLSKFITEGIDTRYFNFDAFSDEELALVSGTVAHLAAEKWVEDGGLPSDFYPIAIQSIATTGLAPRSAAIKEVSPSILEEFGRNFAGSITESITLSGNRIYTVNDASEGSVSAVTGANIASVANAYMEILLDRKPSGGYLNVNTLTSEEATKLFIAIVHPLSLDEMKAGSNDDYWMRFALDASNRSWTVRIISGDDEFNDPRPKMSHFQPNRSLSS